MSMLEGKMMRRWTGTFVILVMLTLTVVVGTALYEDLGEFSGRGSA